MTSLTDMEKEFLKAAYGGTANDLANCLQQGVNVNIQRTDQNGWTALHFASELDDADKVRLLLEWDANPYVKDKYGRNPYQVAGGSNARHLLIEYYDDEKHGRGSVATATDNSEQEMHVDTQNNTMMFKRMTRDIAHLRQDLLLIQACMIAMVALGIYAIFTK